MRYSLEPKFRKHVQGYALCQLLENLELNMVTN